MAPGSYRLGLAPEEMNVALQHEPGPAVQPTQRYPAAPALS